MTSTDNQAIVSLCRRLSFMPDCRPRQRELARSSKFGPVVEAVKGIALDCDSSCSFGGKNFELNHSALLGSIYPQIEVILPSH